MTEEKWIEIDDRSFFQTTKELEAELRRRGIVREGPPDFDAVAARWKARRAADEEAGTLKTFRFIIFTQPQDGRFRACAPTLDGCEARGATPEEAREQLLKALYVRLAEMLAGGETPPSDEGAEIVNVVFPVASHSTE